MSGPLERVLSALDGVKSSGVGWTARCPAHDDRHNSLKIDAGKDGQALIHCHAGCEFDSVLAALDLAPAELFPSRDEAVSQNGHGRHIVDTYDYRGEHGELLYQAVRFAPKGFSQRRPDGKGGWVWNLRETRRVLYRLPELLSADPESWVVVCEGEKDVNRLIALGFVATTNAMGADKWRAEYAETLRGRRVCVSPDNDEAGDKHAAQVAASLYGVADEVRVIHMPDLPPKGDISDWLDAGGTADALRRLIEATAAWEPATGANTSEEHRATDEADPRGAARLVVTPLSQVKPQPVDWFWHRWLPRGKFSLVGGHAGDGKSTLLASLAATGSRLGLWPDGEPCQQRLRTLFLLGEDSAADTLRPRLDLHSAQMDHIFVIETVLDEKGRERFFNVAKHLDLLEAEILERHIDWIVIDPLTTIMPGTDRNQEGDTRDALTPLAKLAERLNVTITGVAHVGKSEGSRRAAQKILGATAFHAMARVVWMIAPDEDDRMVLGVVKSNLAMRPPSLVWSRDEDGPIRWEGVATQDVEDLLSQAPRSSPRADAEGFLREYLSGGSRPSADVEQAAKNRGISRATLRRAAEAVPVKKWKDATANGIWYWSLPDGQSKQAESKLLNDDRGEQVRFGVVGSNLLTPKDAQVSKFESSKMFNGAVGEHLLTTTPHFANGQANGHAHVMEGAQLAHLESLRSEQVRFDGEDGEVVELAKRIADLTAEELQTYRYEIATTPPTDPHIHLDRQALALFDAMKYAGAIA